MSQAQMTPTSGWMGMAQKVAGDTENPPGDDSIQPSISPLDFLPYTEMAVGAGNVARGAWDIAPKLLEDETGAIGPINNKEAAYFKKLTQQLDNQPLSKQLNRPGFNDLRYSYEQPVKITPKNGEPFYDTIKGMNQGHALQNARFNWEGMDVEPVSQSEHDAGVAKEMESYKK
jgi:hypothetical protein